MSRRLQATSIEGGFVFHLVGTGDLGQALTEDVVVELEDGTPLGLFDAVLELLRGRTVAGIVVLTDPAVCRRACRCRSLGRRVELTPGEDPC